MKKINIITLLLIFCLPFAYADKYYADVSINVDELGVVSIDGNTNHPLLLSAGTDNFTSKKQSYWTLNITQEDIFSDYVYKLSLPNYASINYIKSSGSFRIQDSSGQIVITGFGEDKPFSIVVQYQINPKQTNLLIILGVIVLLIIFLLLLIFFILNYKKVRSFKKDKEDVKENFLDHDTRGLTSRQKKIFNLLVENKKPMTQAQIQTELKIPKASVSRNIKSLELKGLIEKEAAGISNLIRVKK